MYIIRMAVATYNTILNLRKWCSAVSEWRGRSLSTPCSSSTVLNCRRLVYQFHGRVLSSLLHLDWWFLGFQQLLHPVVYRNSAAQSPDDQCGLWPDFARIMRAAMTGDQDS